MKNIKVGIITGSTREGRASLDVANWVLDNIKGSEGVSYDIIDIKDYDLPFFGFSDFKRGG
jgi:NAD(P)H-dependent FMN reductase